MMNAFEHKCLFAFQCVCVCVCVCVGKERGREGERERDTHKDMERACGCKRSAVEVGKGAPVLHLRAYGATKKVKDNTLIFTR